MKKILVPIDGSVHSAKALDKAIELGEFYKAEITLLTVIYSGHFENFALQKEVIESEEKTAQKLLLEESKILENYPYGFETTYRVGDVADEIVTMAEENNFDLIVIGSRGVGVFSRSLLGGVSQKIVTHANTTVMVVK